MPRQSRHLAGSASSASTASECPRSVAVHARVLRSNRRMAGALVATATTPGRPGGPTRRTSVTSSMLPISSGCGASAPSCAERD